MSNKAHCYAIRYLPHSPHPKLAAIDQCPVRIIIHQGTVNLGYWPIRTFVLRQCQNSQSWWYIGERAPLKYRQPEIEPRSIIVIIDGQEHGKFGMDMNTKAVAILGLRPVLV